MLTKFWERDFSYEIGDEKVHKRRWLIDVTYGDKQGYIKLTFNPKLTRYLHQLSKNFTVYYIDQVAKFNSIYSVRIYEFCIMEINRLKLDKCSLVISIVEIKERLELDNKYPRLYDFKIYVLNKAKQEINKHSDLTIDFEEIKKGRSVKSIKFIIERKQGAKPAKYQGEEQQELDLNPIQNNLLLT